MGQRKGPASYPSPGLAERTDWHEPDPGALPPAVVRGIAHVRLALAYPASPPWRQPVLDLCLVQPPAGCECLRAWLTEMLGLPATDPATYRWEQVQPADEDYLPPSRRLLHAVADRLRWHNALAEARLRARDALAAEVSATGRAA